MMTTTTSLRTTHDTAVKLIADLGLDVADIRNKNHASLYIFYSHNGNTYEIRVSDHCANPLRTDAKKSVFGYIPVEVGNNYEIAKRVIDHEIFGKKEVVSAGTAINHPAYGAGIAIAHDIEKDKLDVEFNGIIKSFYATTVIDRGWINI